MISRHECTGRTAIAMKVASWTVQNFALKADAKDVLTSISMSCPRCLRGSRRGWWCGSNWYGWWETQAMFAMSKDLSIKTVWKSSLKLPLTEYHAGHAFVDQCFHDWPSCSIIKMSFSFLPATVLLRFAGYKSRVRGHRQNWPDLG